jgi:hypothetical protein
LEQSILACAESISHDIGYEGERFAEFLAQLKRSK